MSRRRMLAPPWLLGLALGLAAGLLSACGDAAPLPTLLPTLPPPAATTAAPEPARPSSPPTATAPPAPTAAVAPPAPPSAPAAATPTPGLAPGLTATLPSTLSPTLTPAGGGAGFPFGPGLAPGVDWTAYAFVFQAMAATPRGQHYRTLFFLYQDEWRALQQQDPAFAQHTVQVLTVWQPAARALMEGRGDQVIITPEWVAAAQAYLDDLAGRASPELAAVVQQEQAYIPWGGLPGASVNAAWTVVMQGPPPAPAPTPGPPAATPVP